MFELGKSYYFGAFFKADLNKLRIEKKTLNHIRELYNSYA